METWHTSDEHYFHANIIRYCNRPWTDVEAMNRALIANHNKLVAPNDHVIHHGDFTFRRDTEIILQQLNGTHTLISGNHDPIWTHAKGGEQRKQNIAADYAAASWKEIHPGGELHTTIDGIDVLLSHLPYTGDSHEHDRYRSLRPVNNGLPLICGHVHDAWRTNGNQINVGVDVWDYRPVHQSELATLIKEAFNGTHS